MPFHNNVQTNFLWDDLEDQVRNKVNEIAIDAGRGSHGSVVLTDQTRCQHWRAGDYRIFGTYGNDILNFIGWGMHTGSGNSKYKVYLPNGTTKAQTT